MVAVPWGELAFCAQACAIWFGSRTSRHFKCLRQEDMVSKKPSPPRSNGCYVLPPSQWKSNPSTSVYPGRQRVDCLSTQRVWIALALCSLALTRNRQGFSGTHWIALRRNESRLDLTVLVGSVCMMCGKAIVTMYTTRRAFLGNALDNSFDGFTRSWTWRLVCEVDHVKRAVREQGAVWRLCPSTVSFLPIPHSASIPSSSLVTLLPGLRVLFLQTKVLDNLTSLDTISALWDRYTSPPDKEWRFWQTLAATGLADTAILAITEQSLLPDLVVCSNEGLSVIEQLLVEHDCGASKHTSALCLRYLAGVLNPPGFWQNLGHTHAQVAHKLCCRTVCVLKDIGVDIPSLGLIEKAPVDYDGVDLLATTLFGGLSNWFGELDCKDWANQPWYGSFVQVLQLLREPRAGELLPNSSATATSLFEDILPTTYQDQVLNVMVDNQNHTVPTEQYTHIANYTMDNLSAHSIVSGLEEENLGQSTESLDDSQSQTADLDSEEVPLEENTAAEHSDSSEEDDDVSDITGYEQQFSMASEHGNVLEDLINGTTGIPRISGTQSVLASTLYYSPEAQRKDLEEWKLILFNKQRDLGENHPETLEAMENLAWLHHELGKYVSARDLRLTVLEKYQILGGEDNPTVLQYKESQEVVELALEKQRKVLGENHPETTRTLSFLALTYQYLGQFNKAQELAMSAVEKHSQLLGEDHPDTLWSMYTVANIYRQLGQLTEAEHQYHIVAEKSIRILGENHPSTLHYDHHGSPGKHIQPLGSAQELATVALEKHHEVFGESHPETVWIMQELASIFQQQGQLGHAEELLVAVLEKRRKLLGDDHPHTRWTMEELANLYQSMGKLQAAEELERLIGDQ
ncbi:hypothetical protein DFH08DRAFT_935628 [Mycena albidolilacea]|uniref:Kinesin light chain n=1 Tax=Mycena albidolilacea TaxID=1033008 RepID=A0AAD7ETX9_9AGAR|nr:hypothetical protein DFH08DRAFT_935628 [Mycena albidolilacea]